MEIDHEISPTVILLPSTDHSRMVVVSYKRKYVYKVLVNCLFKLAQEKDRPAMTIAVDLGRKATKQTNKNQETKGDSSYDFVIFLQMSRDMRFPKMWYVRPAKPQISLHIHAA